MNRGKELFDSYPAIVFSILLVMYQRSVSILLFAIHTKLQKLESTILVLPKIYKCQLYTQSGAKEDKD